MKSEIQIVWFKRDLRIYDHRPLYEASLRNVPTLPLYVIEPDYWKQPFASRRHWQFIHDCLIELNARLKDHGQGLVIRVGDIEEIFQKLLENYLIRTIYAHEETGNGWTFERDMRVVSYCQSHEINFVEYPCNGVVRRLKGRDEWSKIRNRRMACELIPKPVALKPIKGIDPGVLPKKNDPMFGDRVPGRVQKGGRRAATEILNSYLQQRGKNYLYHLSAPGVSEEYCSRLSPHLTWGSLSVREVVKYTKDRRQGLKENEIKLWKRNLSAFSSRLSWRCHFIQKLEDQPSIEYKCMHPAFEGLREAEHNQQFFQAWKNGCTGYPFIDACMRNLIYEGWITFRMRAMLVSFASYHLWLDWRITGYYLARLFTDYEPGIHYSQLQMQSGVTGINTVRIYSPIKQSQEHDPNGVFIRKWLPELRNVSDTWIHEPCKMDDTGQKRNRCIVGVDYPAPIVDHKNAIKSAREKISRVRKQENFRENAHKVYDKHGSRKSKSKREPKRQATQKQMSLDL